MKGFCAGGRSERLGERKPCAQGAAPGRVYFPTRDAVAVGLQHGLRFWGAALSDADLRTAPHRQKGPPRPRAPDKEAVGPETPSNVFIVASRR